MFNVEEQCQRHYTGHTDDVKCIAIHPNRLVIASGQCAGHDRLDARVSDIRVTKHSGFFYLSFLPAYCGEAERLLNFILRYVQNSIP